MIKKIVILLIVIPMILVGFIWRFTHFGILVGVELADRVMHWADKE